MGHYVIFLFPAPLTKWPWEKIWPLSHGRTGNCMTYRRKMKSRPWETRKGHDLQEKNEIQVMGNLERPWPAGEKWNSDHRENGNSMIRRFCLFRMNLYEINHARRNFTFTSKITPRVNFWLYVKCWGVILWITPHYWIWSYFYIWYILLWFWVWQTNPQAPIWKLISYH